MPAPILATKLYIPPPRPKIVVRPRLIERLNEGFLPGRKLTLVSAPAGSGKTTLISEWLAGCSQKAAWLSLDEGDNDLARFLTYLVVALQIIEANLGKGVQGALQSPQLPPIDSILTALLNEITNISHDFILVLDDYHAIDTKAIEDALAFLLDNMPPQMHLVIATREDPPLPLARYRVRGQLTELRAADLCFTASEAAEFLNRVMGLGLSVEDISALENRTEGWIAGLQLAALSMVGHLDIAGFIRSFTGSHHFVLDYLVEEVLQHQTQDVQYFLICTSTLDRLCGSLCEAILLTPTGSGQETLEYLEHANLFIVPLDNERRWFRYHHLFGELLRQRLGQSLTPGEITELHIRASAWHENNGFAFEAFRHAAAAQDVERAERLIGNKDMGLHFHSVATAVLDWLASLPGTVLDARPSLWVRSATVALMAGQTTGVEEKLQAAEKALQNAAPDDKSRDLIGQIACARATLALTRYDPDTMIIQARRALEYLPADDLVFLFTANWALATASFLQGDRVTAARASREGIAISQKSGDIFSTILSTSSLGQVQELENQLYQAAETYQRVLLLSGEYPHPNAGEVHLGLARIYYEWNDLEAAEQHGQQSLQLTRQYDRVIDRFIISEVFLARLKLAQGEVDNAATLLAEIEQSARQQNFLLRLPEIAAAQVLILIRQGNLPAAAQLARQYELPLSHARVLVAQKDPSAALAVLELLRRQMEARGWADERLRTLVLQAVAFYLYGEKFQAFQVLNEALTLAELGGFIRLFVDEGEPMAELLTEMWKEKSRQRAYIHKILAAFRKQVYNFPSSPIYPPLVESFSQRELEILQLIAQGHSNREIGKRLFLALDTVKGHNRRIFEKLQVQSRTEAVVRARELGLIA
ncbi:MAG TPA: LuxR C-terminal-related transcriptional regulator [Anaerolineaceae bacterium]|nr:LuxR C-terminal-related transcriptional regulator [Anaerolineaceae bacterium]